MVTNTGCIESWRCKNANGYPIKVNKEGSRLVHRMIYEEFNGLLPKEVCVLHKCDNPACINPEHLFAGTREDNIRDMCYKGRQSSSKGINHWNGRLKDYQVAEIRSLGKRTDFTHKEISKIYGVTRSYISGILSNRYRKQVKGD